MDHFPAVKFTMGYKKNVSFLVIPNLQKCEKKFQKLNLAPVLKRSTKHFHSANICILAVSWALKAYHLAIIEFALLVKRSYYFPISSSSHGISGKSKSTGRNCQILCFLIIYLSEIILKVLLYWSLFKMHLGSLSYVFRFPFTNMLWTWSAESKTVK